LLLLYFKKNKFITALFDLLNKFVSPLFEQIDFSAFGYLNLLSVALFAFVGSFKVANKCEKPAEEKH